MNQYEQFKNHRQERVNKLPLSFAYSDKQLEEVLKGWGLTMNDLSQVTSLGAGCIALKKDVNDILKAFNEMDQELDAKIKEDKTGAGFIKDMFIYELYNTEYSYTYEYDDALDQLGLTQQDLEENPALKAGLKLAIEVVTGNPDE